MALLFVISKPMEYYQMNFPSIFLILTYSHGKDAHYELLHDPKPSIREKNVGVQILIMTYCLRYVKTSHAEAYIDWVCEEVISA